MMDDERLVSQFLAEIDPTTVGLSNIDHVRYYTVFGDEVILREPDDITDFIHGHDRFGVFYGAQFAINETKVRRKMRLNFEYIMARVQLALDYDQFEGRI